MTDVETREETLSGSVAGGDASDRKRIRLRTPRRRLFRRPRPAQYLGTNLSIVLGSAILVCYLVVLVVSFFWTPYPPRELTIGPLYSAPSSHFLLGTDRLGSDVLSRLMNATRIDLAIVAAAVALALVAGTFLGTVAGYFGGVTDTVIMRVLEIFQSFPTLLLAMLIVQATGPGTANVILVMAFVGAPEYLRLVRAEILSRKSWPFAEAARLGGSGPWRIAFRHLLPNSVGPVVAYTSINAAWVCLLAASLGFLGLGLPPGTPEWGAMISGGQDAIVTGQWWVSFFPGLAILGLSGACYLLGDGLTGRFAVKGGIK